MNQIKKFCITNGTVDKEQRNLYEGGTVPGKADLVYALREISGIMQRGDSAEYQSFGYASSYSGIIYDTLFCFGRTMFQNASGREIPASQILICAWEDLEGDAFIDEVIRFPYLSLDELLKSASYKRKQIFEREPVELGVGIELNPVQRMNIARVAYWLLSEKNVVLQIPDGENYEKLSLYILQEIYSLLPKRDRREVSFSTARNQKDIMRLRGKFQLILTNESTPKTGEAQWIRLNGEEPLTKEEEVLQKWMREDPRIRGDIEKNFFSFDQGQDEEKRRSLKKDYATLEKFYNPEAYWWKDEDAGQRFSSFNEVLAELDKNPTLAPDIYRKSFFRKVSALLDHSESGEQEPERNLISILLDYLVIGKATDEKKEVLLKRIGRFKESCPEEYQWFGLSPEWIGKLSDEIALAEEIMNSQKRA